MSNRVDVVELCTLNALDDLTFLSLVGIYLLFLLSASCQTVLKVFKILSWSISLIFLSRSMQLLLIRQYRSPGIQLRRSLRSFAI